MDTSEIAGTLTTLFAELVEGAPETGAYMLNPRDAGLLRSLDQGATWRHIPVRDRAAIPDALQQLG